MTAFDLNQNAVEIEVYGERVILRNGEIFTGRQIDLPHDEQRYFDLVCDDLYDLPLFNGEFISAKFNIFEARQPARIIAD